MSKRPGGLTALAVLNFVFGGIGIIVNALAFIGLSLIKEANEQLIRAAKASGGEVTDVEGIINITGAQVSIAIALLAWIIAIAAGVGYLGQKKGLGLKGGTMYAVLAIISSILAIAWAGTGFGFGTIIGLIYPVLTLVLLNGTFKKDFIN